MTTTVETSGAERTTDGPWRPTASTAAVLAAVGMVGLLVATRQVIPPAIVLAVLFVGAAVALRRVEGRWPLYVVTVLAVLTVAGNAPFIVSDLSHPETAAGFAPTVVILVSVVVAFIAGVLALRRSTASPRPVAATALGIGVVAVVGSVVANVSLSDDERQDGDVEVVAQGVEFPDEVRATAGEVGFFVENEDAIRHTFLIEGTDVKQEVPGTKDRRVTADLDAGTYRFYCDVPGHEDMEGTLVVEG